MADSLRARVLDARDGVGGTWRELLGRPGAVYWYAIDFKKQVDVCCPGCGDYVFQLEADRFPMGGSELAPSCAVEIKFACCGWTGKLTDGVWIPAAPAG